MGWKLIAAEYGRTKDLDLLVNDRDPAVRVAVTQHGRDEDLETLIKDPDVEVRLAVRTKDKDRNPRG